MPRLGRYQEADNTPASEDAWDALKDSTFIPRSMLDALLEIMNTNKSLQTRLELFEHSGHGVLEANKRLMAENESLRRRLDPAPFILLLIDGDAAQFSDDFVTQGISGGSTAAHLLQSALEKFMIEHLRLSPSTKVIVRVYTNAVGLKQVYANAGILGKPSIMWDFAAAFNRELPLAEFVDAGADKEAADNKIKANIDLFWRDENCKHILLAGSADRGYVSYLRQYSYRAQDRARLTLIETKPFPQDFRELASVFGNGEKYFDDLFRSTHIVAKYVAAKAVPVSPIMGRENLAPAVTATTAPAVQPSSRSASPESDAMSEWNVVQRAANTNTAKIMIPLNKKNQRIHKPLEYYDGKMADEIRARGLCPYKILTKCVKKDCPYNHKDVPLTEKERRVLIYIHRITPCPDGFKCRDRYCVHGHHCLYDETCYFEPCKYTKAQHFVDKVVHKEV